MGRFLFAEGQQIISLDTDSGIFRRVAPQDRPVRVLVMTESEATGMEKAWLLAAGGFQAFVTTTPIGLTKRIVRHKIGVLVVAPLSAIPGDRIVQLVRRDPRLAHVATVMVCGPDDAHGACNADVDLTVASYNEEEDLVIAVRRAVAGRRSRAQ